MTSTEFLGKIQDNWMRINFVIYVEVSGSKGTHGVIFLHIAAIVYYINTLVGLSSQIREGQGRAL